MLRLKAKRIPIILLFLLSVSLIASSPSINIKASTTDSLAMKGGILAHELTDLLAQNLSYANFSYIEADVSFDSTTTNWDTIYQLSKKYNLTLIGKLLPHTVNWNNNFTLQDWNDTVQRAVNDYADIVKIWEIWNEPINPNNTLGYFNGSSSSYTEMLKTAHEIIKSESQDATVIGFGGLHLYSGNDPYATQGLEFAQEVVSLGGMNYCDAISLHAYPWGPYNSTVQDAFTVSITNYRNITGKDIWITETGQRSEDFKGVFYSEEEQANYLSESFNLFKQLNVKAYIWYELNDNQTRTEDEGTFGLFDTASKTKEAYHTFINLLNPFYWNIKLQDTSPTNAGFYTGSFTLSGTYPVLNNTLLNITANANVGYTFLHWVIGTSQSNNNTFKDIVLSNQTLYAVFIPIPTPTFTPTPTIILTPTTPVTPTPTITPTTTPTPTITLQPTNTPSPTATPSPTQTTTPTQSPTSTPTVSPSPSITPTDKTNAQNKTPSAISPELLSFTVLLLAIITVTLTTLMYAKKKAANNS